MEMNLISTTYAELSNKYNQSLVPQKYCLYLLNPKSFVIIIPQKMSQKNSSNNEEFFCVNQAAIFRVGLLRYDFFVPPAFWYCSESLPNLVATPVSIRSLKTRNNFSLRLLLSESAKDNCVL